MRPAASGPECVKTPLRSKALYRIFISLYVEAAGGLEPNDDLPRPQHSQRNAHDRWPRRFDSLFGLPGRCRYSRAKFRCSSPQSGSCYAVRSFGLGSRHRIGQFTLGHLCNRRYRRCICCVPLGGADRKSSGRSLSDVGLDSDCCSMPGRARLPPVIMLSSQTFGSHSFKGSLRTLATLNPWPSMPSRPCWGANMT